MVYREEPFTGAARLSFPLQQDFGRGLGRAPGRNEIDRRVQVCLAAGEALGERERIPGLDQDMQTPALDLWGDLDQLGHRAWVRAYLDEPFRAKVGRERYAERDDSSAETRSCA